MILKREISPKSVFFRKRKTASSSMARSINSAVKGISQGGPVCAMPTRLLQIHKKSFRSKGAECARDHNETPTFGAPERVRIKNEQANVRHTTTSFARTEKHDSPMACCTSAPGKKSAQKQSMRHAVVNDEKRPPKNQKNHFHAFANY